MSGAPSLPRGVAQLAVAVLSRTAQRNTRQHSDPPVMLCPHSVLPDAHSSRAPNEAKAVAGKAL